MVEIMVDGESFSRSLGRLEGMAEAILKRMDSLDVGFAAHKEDDQRNFSSLRLLIQTTRKEIDEHLSTQDVANERLKAQDENTRAVGKWILTVFAGLATLVGSAVVAALTHHLTLN